MNNFELIKEGEILVAKTHVPEIMEPGCVFNKGEVCKIHSIENDRIGIMTKWGSVEYFSTRNQTNYLWEWFKRV